MRIDDLFLNLLEKISTAGYLPSHEKVKLISEAVNSNDLIKFFLQIAWELRYIDNKKYILLSKDIHEVGKMLYGWHSYLIDKNSRRHPTGENK